MADDNTGRGMVLFEEKYVRRIWDEKSEKWYFSVVDVVAVLTDSDNPRHYWTVLKSRIKEEGNETVTNCERFKMLAADGKMRLTDCANAESLLRIIQSIPSPKAEPFKLLSRCRDKSFYADKNIIPIKKESRQESIVMSGLSSYC